MRMPPSLDSKVGGYQTSGELTPELDAKPADQLILVASPRTPPAGFVGCGRCQKSFPDGCLVRDEHAHAILGACPDADDAAPAPQLRCPPCQMTEQTQRTVELLSTDERESRSGALQHIQPLLVKLRQHPSAKPFLQPVDPVRLRVPDYYSRVKEPMDLSLVKLRLTKGYYASIDDLARDVARVWENACAFNPVGSIVHRFAQECRAFWAEHLEATLQAHAAGLLQSVPCRKRRPVAKRDDAEPAAAADGALVTAPAAPRQRPPKAPKRERSAENVDASAGAADSGAPAAAGRASFGAAALRAAQGLAKGWAFEVVPLDATAEMEPAAAGQPRVRKAKVRWEPEEIAVPASERKAGKEGLPQSVTPVGGVRKQRRMSGSGSKLAQGAGHDYHDYEPHYGAFDTPGAMPYYAGTLGFDHDEANDPELASVPATLYDVAAALPEIDVGQDMEGVAGDLDDLLDFDELHSQLSPLEPLALEPVESLLALAV